jgi:hypothetical protein
MNTTLRSGAQEFTPSSLKATAQSYVPPKKTKVEAPPPVGASTLNKAAQEFVPRKTPNGSAPPPAFPSSGSPMSASQASSAQASVAPAASSTTTVPATSVPESPTSPDSTASYITRSSLVPSCTMIAPPKPPMFRNRWSLYADNHLDASNWEPVLVSEVVDVAMFWRVFRHITPLSQCLSSVQKFTYNLFKTGVKPSWEDSRNIDGCLLITRVFAPAYIDAGFSDKDALNDAFLLMAMGACGGTLGADQINGIVFKSRKGEVNVEVWCNHCDRTRLEVLCTSLRELLSTVIPKIAETKFTMMENRHRGQPASPSSKKPTAIKL